MEQDFRPTWNLTPYNLNNMLFILLNNIYITLFYYIKYSALNSTSSTDKSDNLTCEIIHDNLTCENYRFSIIALLIIAFHRLYMFCTYHWTVHIMFNTRNKSGISKHPCIILYVYIYIRIHIFGNDQHDKKYI
jgi:hypothetical protein